MFKNKKILTVVIAVLAAAIIISIGALTAYAAGDVNKGNSVVDEQEDSVISAAKQAKLDEVPLNADGTANTDGARGSRIKANGSQSGKETSELAAKLGIDTTGMSEEEIARAIKNYMYEEKDENAYFEEQKEYAELLGVDTDGMTTGDEIREAIRSYKASVNGREK